MIIDTNNLSKWVATHLKISVPIATGFLSWFAAMRWQAAIQNHTIALSVYYFCVSAVSGIFTVVLVILHFIKIGFFD